MEGVSGVGCTKASSRASRSRLSNLPRNRRQRIDTASSLRKTQSAHIRSPVFFLKNPTYVQLSLNQCGILSILNTYAVSVRFDTSKRYPTLEHFATLIFAYVSATHKSIMEFRRRVNPSGGSPDTLSRFCSSRLYARSPASSKLPRARSPCPSHEPAYKVSQGDN